MRALRTRFKLMLVCSAAFCVYVALPISAFDLGGAFRGVLGGGLRGGALGGLLGGGNDPTGGVLGLPGQALTGPAIKDWEAANDRSIDKLGQTLDGNIDKFGKTLDVLITTADAMLGKNIKDVNVVLAANIESLNRVFQATTFDLDSSLHKAIDQLDESLAKNVGSLDTVSVKTAANFERLFRRLLLYGCMLVFLTFCVWQIYQEVLKTKGSVRTPALRIGGVFAGLGALVLASFLYLPSQEDEAALIKSTRMHSVRVSTISISLGRPITLHS